VLFPDSLRATILWNGRRGQRVCSESGPTVA
jgi:hypothetical protein